MAHDASQMSGAERVSSEKLESETYGPLTLTRHVKRDGRALILYARTLAPAGDAPTDDDAPPDAGAPTGDNAPIGDDAPTGEDAPIRDNAPTGRGPTHQ